MRVGSLRKEKYLGSCVLAGQLASCGCIAPTGRTRLNLAKRDVAIKKKLDCCWRLKGGNVENRDVFVVVKLCLHNEKFLSSRHIYVECVGYEKISGLAKVARIWNDG